MTQKFERSCPRVRAFAWFLELPGCFLANSRKLETVTVKKQHARAAQEMTNDTTPPPKQQKPKPKKRKALEPTIEDPEEEELQDSIAKDLNKNTQVEVQPTGDAVKAVAQQSHSQ